MKIAKAKEWIKKAYRDCEDFHNAHCNSLGYIKGLKKAEWITGSELRKLYQYNDDLAIEEIMKKAIEDIKKNEKEKEELEEMELERIKKRIDETLDKGYVIESSGRLDEDEIEGIKFLIEEYRKALNIYKALVIKVDEICHGHLPFTTMRMTQAVQDLEEKFYPRPKTTKEKIEEIKDSIIHYTENRDIRAEAADALIDLLKKIMD